MLCSSGDSWFVRPNYKDLREKKKTGNLAGEWLLVLDEKTWNRGWELNDGLFWPSSRQVMIYIWERWRGVGRNDGEIMHNSKYRSEVWQHFKIILWMCMCDTYIIWKCWCRFPGLCSNGAAPDRDLILWRRRWRVDGNQGDLQGSSASLSAAGVRGQTASMTGMRLI